MNVLLDACVPRPLRKFLPDHTVRTAQEMGWGQLKNGALLQAVEPQFDAFLTSYQNLIPIPYNKRYKYLVKGLAVVYPWAWAENEPNWR